MLDHYMNGHGEDFVLQRPQMNDIVEAAMGQIGNQIGEVLDPNNPSGSITVALDCTNIPGLFCLGDTQLIIDYNCAPSFAGDGSFGCEVTITVDDSFVDAIDIPDLVPGNQDVPSSNPFNITGDCKRCQGGITPK